MWHALLKWAFFPCLCTCCPITLVRVSSGASWVEPQDSLFKSDVGVMQWEKIQCKCCYDPKKWCNCCCSKILTEYLVMHLAQWMDIFQLGLTPNRQAWVNGRDSTTAGKPPVAGTSVARFRQLGEGSKPNWENLFIFPKCKLHTHGSFLTFQTLTKWQKQFLKFFFIKKGWNWHHIMQYP